MTLVCLDLWNTIIFCPTRDRVGKISLILGSVGIECDYEEIMEWVRGMPMRGKATGELDFARALCEHLGAPYDDDLLRLVGSTWQSRLDDTRAFPDTIPALTSLGRKHELCIISNLDEGARAHFLKNHSDVAELFHFHVFSCRVGLIKPDARIYRLALEHFGASPEDSWMVGDNLRADYEGSRDAGLNPVLLDRRGMFKYLDFVRVESLTELEALIV